jgi:replicative DNA helicase
VYLSGQPLRYTTACEVNSAAVADAARTFGCRVSRHAGRGGWHQLVIAGNGNRWQPAGVNAWLRGLGIFGQRSADKRVPETAFRLPADQVALLLRHLWATDGTIWSGRRRDGRAITRVAFSTASYGLALDVAALLLRLGILSRLTAVRQPSGTHLHNVVVSGAPAQRAFLARVGGFGPREPQAEALRAMLADMAANTNVDTLPREAWAPVHAEMRRQGITQRGMAALRGTSYGGSAHFAFAPSRAVLADYAARLDAPELARAATDDLFWDRVVAVEPAGEEDVYDLTVPGPANWLADGIVTHNSGQIEQDADLVMFIYREEYYDRGPKDEDATDYVSEHENEAEILIAKHRNGGLGTVPLTFIKKYPKFMNRARGDQYA